MDPRNITARQVFFPAVASMVISLKQAGFRHLQKPIRYGSFLTVTPAVRLDEISVCNIIEIDKCLLIIVDSSFTVPHITLPRSIWTSANGVPAFPAAKGLMLHNSDYRCPRLNCRVEMGKKPWLSSFPNQMCV